LLRSIDSTSSINPNLDRSIQDAYKNAIRKAETFIYIENQYFMGSSEYWDPPRPGCINKIPYEICRKIELKIEQNQPFSVYVVMPMFPEGVPGDTAVQELLFWQSCTMKFMYKRLATALSKAGSKKNSSRLYKFFLFRKSRNYKRIRRRCKY